VLQDSALRRLAQPAPSQQTMKFQREEPVTQAEAAPVAVLMEAERKPAAAVVVAQV